MPAFNAEQFHQGWVLLRQSFLKELPQRLAIIHQGCATLETGQAIPPALQEAVHRLAGAAGSFGYTELGQAARQLERDILAHAPTTPTLALLDEWAKHCLVSHPEV